LEGSSVIKLNKQQPRCASRGKSAGEYSSFPSLEYVKLILMFSKDFEIGTCARLEAWTNRCNALVRFRLPVRGEEGMYFQGRCRQHQGSAGSVGRPLWSPIDEAMKLYVEVTHTEQSDLHTGIQRVVRNVLRHLLDLGSENGINVLPVIFRSGSFVVVSPERVFGPKAHRSRPGSGKWLARLVSALPRRVRRFVEVRFGSSVAKLMRAEPKEKHVLLLLDASWGYEIRLNS